MIALIIACVLLFALAVTGWARWESQRSVYAAKCVAHEYEISALKKVGKWYENRVQELEEESALLAAQLVSGGAVPIKNAMPSPGRDPEETWAFDATGLVAERLDPRDIPSAL